MKDQSIHVNTRLISAPLAVAALLLAVFGLARAGVLAPPQVIDLEPDAGAHTAPVDASISVTYDQDMDPATVNPQSFVVHARQTGWLTETLSVSGGTITLDPLNVLHASELVEASATTATLSLGGEAPLAPTVWQFTTAAWGGNAQFHEHQLLRESLSRFVAIGDLDGDGDLDAITSRANGNTRIYHNDGSGTLSEVQNFDHTAYHITDVELGDLDGDGDLDAVLICYTGSGNRVLFNNGDGTFTDSGESIWSEYDLFAKLGDLDGDGDLDLFVAGTEFVGTIRVWMNDGTGYFTLASDFDTAYEHYGVALGDLDRDGDLDAFTTGWNNTYNKVWLNDGKGVFSEAQVIPNANTSGVQLGDLDGDGDLDAYLTNTQVHYTGNLPDEVWLNNGKGHFTDSGQRLDTLDSVLPALGDLDADGDLDVYLPGEVYHRQPDEVWANDGTGTFTLFRSVDENYASGGATLGDLDGDGNLDVIAFGNNINDDGFQVYLNGDWTQAAPIPHGSANSATVQCPDDPDRFYVIGGWSGPDEPITQTLRFDADTGDWFRLAQLPSEISSAAAVCYQDKIYVAGGEWFDISDDFYIYDIPADSWSNGLSLPRQVKGAAMGAWDGRLYLVGGTPESNDQGLHPVNQVDVYDIAAQTWDADALPPMPAAASFPGYTQAGPYLYVVGGYSGDYDANVTVTQRLDMAIGQWQAGPEFTSARAMLAAAISGQHFYAIGGDLNAGDELDATDLVERLDLADWPDGSWQDLGDPLPAISQGNTSACTNALLGGEVWSTGGGYIDDDGNPHIYDSNLFHPAEACLSYGLALAPESLTGEGYPGTSVDYELTITSTGDITDYFSVAATGLWTVNVPAEIGPLGAGESATLHVSVDIPPEAALGDWDTAVVTATSMSNPAEWDSSSLTTTAVTDWAEAAPIPHPSANAATVQCPDDRDHFYLIGGWWASGAITQTLRYDTDAGNWIGLAPLPKQLSSIAAVCYENKIYVAGGEWPDINDDLYIYNIAADSWSFGPPVPRPVMGAALGAWDGKLYLVSGTQTHEIPGLDPVNQVDVYDIAAQTWDADALPHMPAAASFPGYAQAGPYLYVVGGYSGDYDANVAATQRLDMSTEQWETGPAFTSARAMLPAAITGQTLYAIGGDLSGGDWLDATDMVERLDLSDWPDGSWQNLGDPLPAISQGNTSACTNALLGGEIWSIGGGYIDDDWNPHVYDSNLFHPAETCLGYNYAVTLAPAVLGYFGYPGEIVTYTLTVTNSGDTPDAYDIELSSAWSALMTYSQGALDTDKSSVITVTVEVPLDAAPGEQDVATVTITSQGDPDVSTSADLTTTALEVFAHLEVGHLAPFAMDPGTAVTVTLDGTTVLTGFEFAESTGYISVTANVTHTVEIFAMGVPTPAIRADINLMPDTDYTAMAVGGANDWPLELLALEDDNRAPAAGSFKLRLGHLAPFSDTITGTLADIRLQDGTPVITDVPFGAVADYIELAAGEYDLKVTTPGGGTTLIDPLPATFNAGDIVSAFAVGDGANQPLGVFAWPAGVPGSLLPLVRYDVELTPASLAGSTYPGEMVEYTLTLSNTGNFTDTFDLTYTGSEWEVTLPVTPTTLAAGASIEVSVQVVIPADAAKGATASATITATSQGDPTVSTSAELTTTAVWRQVYMPLISNQKSSR